MKIPPDNPIGKDYFLYFCPCMQTVTPFSIRRVRFRRWNRHSYSTFCSIGRCINIGCVRKEIADQSLRKGLLLLAPHGYNLSRERRDDEALPDDASPESLLVPTWATTWTVGSEATAPCGPCYNGAHISCRKFYPGTTVNRPSVSVFLYPISNLKIVCL